MMWALVTITLYFNSLNPDDLHVEKKYDTQIQCLKTLDNIILSLNENGGYEIKDKHKKIGGNERFNDRFVITKNNKTETKVIYTCLDLESIEMRYEMFGLRKAKYKEEIIKLEKIEKMYKEEIITDEERKKMRSKILGID